MPDRLYTNADQLAPITSSPDAGIDIVPGNVLKIAFVELAGAGFTAASIITQAAWTTALTAAGHDKVVISPFIDSFKLEPGKPLTEGGNDTTTFNGVPRVRSTGYSTGTGKFSGASSDLMQNLRALGSKSGTFQHGTRLGIILLHEGQGITCLAAGKAIPVHGIHIGDPMKGGLGASDDYEFQFYLEGNWSKNQLVLDAGFVVSSLTNPAGA